MKLKNKSIEDICSFLAGRIRSERLMAGYTQQQIAEKAGISLRTYKRFEYTGRGNIEIFVRMLMVFNKLKVLEEAFPPSPSRSRQAIIARFEELAKKASRR